MLDFRAAQEISEKVFEETEGKIALPFEEAIKMERIPVGVKYTGRNVFAVQNGNTTVLVSADFTRHGVIVDDVKEIEW